MEHCCSETCGGMASARPTLAKHSAKRVLKMLGWRRSQSSSRAGRSARRSASSARVLSLLIFVRPAPRPAAFYFGLERETEESPDTHDASKQRDAFTGQRRGDRGDDVCTHQQFQSQENAAA